MAQDLYGDMVSAELTKQLDKAQRHLAHTKAMAERALLRNGEWVANDPNPSKATQRAFARFEAAELAMSAVEQWHTKWHAIEGASATAKTVHLIEGPEASGLPA
jgi:hypothetical protein